MKLDIKVSNVPFVANGENYDIYVSVQFLVN